MPVGEPTQRMRYLLGMVLQTSVRGGFDKYREKSIEGHWSQHQTLLGSEVNTELMMIRLTEEKFEQARSLILSNELAPGKYDIPLKRLQQLRGLCVHWLTCNLFWRCLCQPTDLLLAHESESCLLA